MSLVNSYPIANLGDVLKLSGGGAGLTGSLQTVQDNLGNNSGLKLSTTGASIAGVSIAGVSGKTFTVNNTLTLSGTDGSTLNVGTGGTLGSNAYTSTAYQASDATLTTLSGKSVTGSGNIVLATSPTITTLSVTSGAITYGGALALGATSTDGFLIQNTTPAALGAQQISPRLHFIAQGWKTTGSASETQDFIVELLPVQGASHSTSQLNFSSQVAGGGYTQVLQLIGSNNSTSCNVLVSSGQFSCSGGNTIFPASGNGCTIGAATGSTNQTTLAIPNTVTYTATSGTTRILQLLPTFSSASTATTVCYGLTIEPTINFSNGTPGSGHYEALRIAVTETSLQTGTNYLLNCLAGSAGTTQKFAVTNTGNLTLAGTITTYNGVTTAGLGLVMVTGSGRATAQTAANASIATYTVGSSDGTFEVSANVNVTTSTLHSFTVTVSYTDETNTAQTLTLNFSQLTGTFITAITNGTGTGPYEGVPVHLRCKASTAITIKTAAGGTYTTVTYNVEGSIRQLA